MRNTNDKYFCERTTGDLEGVFEGGLDGDLVYQKEQEWDVNKNDIYSCERTTGDLDGDFDGDSV